jgi:hypothetical protein
MNRSTPTYAVPLNPNDALDGTNSYEAVLHSTGDKQLQLTTVNATLGRLSPLINGYAQQ